LPTAEILRGSPVPVPSCSGSADVVKRCYENAGFSVTQSTTYSDKPEGDYLSTTCDPYRGGVCTMVYSKGPRPGEPSASPTP
jgi:hypothetical protein